MLPNEISNVKWKYLIAINELFFTKPSNSDNVTNGIQEVEVDPKCQQHICSMYGIYSVCYSILNIMYSQIILNHETFSTTYINSQWLLKQSSFE